MSCKAPERPKVTVTAWDFIKDNYDPDDRLAVVIKNPHENRVTQRMDTARAIASPDFQKWLREHNEHGAEIYLMTNALMPKSSTRTRQDVMAIRHVYLDIDAEGPAVLQKVMTDPRVPKPNYVVNTSPEKFQTTWKVQDFSVGQAETLQRIMAAEFGADRAVVDAARVLRVPGFTNHKYREPHFITAQRHSTEVYRSEDFRFPLPEFASDTSNLSRTATTKAGSSKAKPSKEISQSERDWAYAKQRLAMGADPEQVVQAITEYRPDKWNPGDYARRTVEKAKAELQSTGSPEEARNPLDR
jgi:hypothetical protein